MPNFFNISPHHFKLFLLILTRIGGIILFAPILGHKNIPVKVKIGLSLLLSLVLYPIIRSYIDVNFSSDIFFYTLIILKELGIGMILGWAAKTIFAAVQLSGQFIGMQVGFGIVNIIDPQGMEQISIIGVFEDLLAILIFLAINGHHWFLQAIVRSFELVSPLNIKLSDNLLHVILKMSGDIFLIAIKLSAPVIVVAILINLAMGIVARTVPQINVFFVGFPIQIAVGLIALGLSSYFFLVVLKKSFLQLQGAIFLIIKLI
ncbi:MAG: flagellar biosynthetic protein FliR [bacterium]